MLMRFLMSVFCLISGIGMIVLMVVEDRYSPFFILLCLGALILAPLAWLQFNKWNKLTAELQNKHDLIINSRATKEDIISFKHTYDSCVGLLRVHDVSERAVIDKMKDEVMFHAAIGEMLPASTELERLAELRRKGIISDDEFKAFSERFTVSAGEKAMKIVEAIHSLHVEHEQGALSLGNYHSAVWSLLDKMDRHI